MDIVSGLFDIEYEPSSPDDKLGRRRSYDLVFTTRSNVDELTRKYYENKSRTRARILSDPAEMVPGRVMGLEEAVRAMHKWWIPLHWMRVAYKIVREDEAGLLFRELRVADCIGGMKFNGENIVRAFTIPTEGFGEDITTDSLLIFLDQELRDKTREIIRAHDFIYD